MYRQIFRPNKGCYGIGIGNNEITSAPDRWRDTKRPLYGLGSYVAEYKSTDPRILLTRANHPKRLYHRCKVR